MTDFVIILNTDDAVKAFSHGGNVTLGGNISVAAGPVGRSAEASGTVGNLAAVYSYSKTKGLFAGVSIEGSAIIERKDANETFYGKKVSAKELLSGKIPPPAIADPLYDALDKRSKMSSSEHLDRRDSASRRDSYNSHGAGRSDLAMERRASASRYGADSVSRSDTFKPPVPLPVNSSSIRPPGNPFGEFKPNATLTQRAPPPIPNRPCRQENAVALYDFAGEQTGDLPFKKGDIIIVSKKDGDWWTGTCKGREGIFPSNYVQLN